MNGNTAEQVAIKFGLLLATISAVFAMRLYQNRQPGNWYSDTVMQFEWVSVVKTVIGGQL
jgi:hypothetical protein